MILNFLKLLFRNLLKNRIFTFVNISNLVIGYTTFILFSCFIYDELHWDRHNDKFERIYRIQGRIETAEGTEINQYTPAALCFHVLDTIPGIEKAEVVVEMNDLKGMYLSQEGKEPVNDKMGFAAGSSIFDIFTYDFIEGSPVRSLDEPYQVVLSSGLAKKLFGDEPALGKIILIDKKMPFKVTGVYKDLPGNSYLRPSYLISLETFNKLITRWDYQNEWYQNISFTYILLHKGVKPESIDDKIEFAFRDIYHTDQYHFFLRPLSKLHLSGTNQNDYYILLSVLSLAALLLLILSAINYVNLNTANATTRAKEIGIKKVVGGSRSLLIIQFLAESLILTTASILAGIIIADALLPYFKFIIRRDLQIDIWQTPALFSFLALCGLITGLLAGLYPALIVSRFNPAKVLKGNLYVNRGGSGLKKILNTAQFSISLFLLLSGLIVYRQVHFILDKDMGFEKNNMLYTHIITFDKVPYEPLRQRMLSHPEIENFSFSNTMPFIGNIGGYYDFEGGLPDEKVSTSRNYVTYDFIPTFGIRLKEGRNFSREMATDRNACIINETAVKAFGWKDDPVGKRISGNQLTVIGVVDDFHPYSPFMEIPPFILLLREDTLGTGCYTIRYKSGMRAQAMKSAGEELAYFLPRDPFELKDFVSTLSNDETFMVWRSVERLTGLYAILAVMISSIGLFGLMLFTTRKRVKEIGVRKVFGGSVKNIFGLMTFEVLKLILISVIVAFPAGMYFYDELPGAYKYHLQVWEFLIALGITVLVAFLTVSYQLWRAATINPVKALRYE